MKYFLLPAFALIISPFCQAQYTEEWSDPVVLTDSLSFNSNPMVLVMETVTYMFYEKKFTVDGPSAVYYRDIKNMGDETELLGDPGYSFRNPVLVEFNNPDPGYCMLYEADLDGNFNLYALRFDEFMNAAGNYQLTYTAGDENGMSYTGNTAFAVWENDGNIMAGKLIHEADTVYLQNISTVDNADCSRPVCTQTRILYSKLSADSAALYYTDWNYSQAQWGDPMALDTMGNNSYYQFPLDNLYWFGIEEDCIIYEKEGRIFNYFYDEFYELTLSGFEGDMHEPHSAFYDIPVDNLPGPIFVAFTSEAEGNKDVYVHWSLGWGDPVINLSDDILPSSNPRFAWGWYASGPCSRYFMNIWETERNGFRTLDMSKCALYVCGGIDDENAATGGLQVSPNPFGDVLTIRFMTAGDDAVTVEMRSVSGQLLDRMKPAKVLPGWNEISWRPAGHIASGILYISVIQGQRQLFRKVIYK